MKRIFLLLLMPLFCYSQQSSVDSLERLLPSAATDSARFHLLYQIGGRYLSINYDSALFYFNQSLLLVHKNGKQLNEADVLAFKGWLFVRLQRLTESFQVLTAALQITEDSSNKNKFWNIKRDVNHNDYRLGTVAVIHNMLGVFMLNADRTDQAVFHFNESRKMFGAIGDTLGVGILISNLGYLYLEKLNQPDSALQLEQVAESIFVEKGNETQLGFVYAVMGASYEAKHHDSLALAYFYKAISINKKYDNQLLLAVTYRALTKF